MMAPEAKSEGELCLACGLCCSGAMFDNVDLQPSEVDAVAGLGARLDTSERPRMVFPCTFLNCTACTIYDRRPAVCKAYRCELLQNREQGGIDDAKALHLITKALDLVSAVEALLPESQTIAQSRRAMQLEPEFWHKLSGDEQSQALQLVMAMAALNLHLDRHFRDDVQQVIRNT